MQGRKKSFQYLGFEFDGKRVYIRSSSLSRYYRKMKKRVRRVAYQTKYSKINRSKIYKKKIYEDYSHLGKRNFLTYTYRAAKIMNQQSIKRQVRKHWKILHEELEVKAEKANLK